MFSFDLWGQIPGQSATPLFEVVAPKSLVWGRTDHQRFIPVILDGSSRDAGNTGFTDVLRPGLLLGKVTSGGDVGKFKQWSSTATDGTNRIAAILLSAQKIQNYGTDIDRIGGYIMVAGQVKSGGIAIPSSATYGIVGHALEYIIRAQLHPFFQLDDMPGGPALGNSFGTLTADATITAAQNGTHFLVAGTGAVVATLPATPALGLNYKFTNTVDQNLTITAGTPDTMIVFNDIAADSVAVSTASKKVGATFEVIGTGSAWVVIPSTWTDGTNTQTITIAS
jgi:hypothetical protein